MNDEILKSLLILYDKISNSQISIKLIKILAQYHKLETFIDDSGYTISLKDQNQDQDERKTRRLTIAGVSILIDIDHLKNDKVIRVLLSSDKHLMGKIKEKQNIEKRIEQCEMNIKSLIDKQGINVKNDVIVVQLTDQNNPFFFFYENKENVFSSEKILHDNLKCETLGNFPKNLKLLATLDRISSNDFNMFSYYEKIAFLLYTINLVENLEIIKKETKHNFIEEIIGSTIGKVMFNSIDDQCLGILIYFWKDFREDFCFIQDRNKKETKDLKIYKITLGVEIIENKERFQKNYLLENHNMIWSLVGKNIEFQKYKFVFNDCNSNSKNKNENMCTMTNSANWSLTLDSSDSIFLPFCILEEFDFSLYYTEKIKDNTNEIFKKLNSGSDFNFKINFFNNNEKYFIITNKINDINFIPVKTVFLNHLNQLNYYFFILRNFIVLLDLYKNLLKYKHFDTETTSIDNVTDKNELDLNSYNIYDNFNNLMDMNNNSNCDVKNDKNNFFVFSLEEIDFSSPYNELIFFLFFIDNGEIISLKFKIKNGIFIKLDELFFNEKCEKTMNDKYDAFINLLNKSADLIGSLYKSFFSSLYT